MKDNYRGRRIKLPGDGDIVSVIKAISRLSTILNAILQLYGL